MLRKEAHRRRSVTSGSPPWISATIEKLGVTPLKSELDRIESIRTLQDMLNATARLQYIGAGPLFSVYIFQDEKDSTKFALHLYQGGLGLPDRDYYFDQDERTTRIRDEYKKHLVKMFQLMGDTEAKASKNAETVFRIETDLAHASRKLQDLRDPHKNYNKMKILELSKLTPSLNWGKFLEESHVRDLETVIVGQPEFFEQVEKSLVKESLDDWKTYLRWNLINTFADKVKQRFRQAELLLLRNGDERNARTAASMETDARFGRVLPRVCAG